MAITRINHFYAAMGRERGLRDFLSSIISMVEAAPGCQAAELLVDRDEQRRFVILERWSDVSAHQAAAKLIPPAKLAEIGPLLAEPPQGRYYDMG